MNNNTQAILGPDQELLHQGDSEGYEFSASQTDIAGLQRLDAYLTFVQGIKADDSPATSDSDLPIPFAAGEVSSSSLPFVSSRWYVNTSLIQDHGSCVSRNKYTTISHSAPGQHTVPYTCQHKITLAVLRNSWTWT
jgi:hypothetical protein